MEHTFLALEHSNIRVISSSKLTDSNPRAVKPALPTNCLRKPYYGRHTPFFPPPERQCCADSGNQCTFFFFFLNSLHFHKFEIQTIAAPDVGVSKLMVNKQSSSSFCSFTVANVSVIIFKKPSTLKSYFNNEIIVMAMKTILNPSL